MVSTLRTLLLVLLSVGGVVASIVQQPLHSRWASLQIQINASEVESLAIDSVSVADAAAILSGHDGASQWLHDIGEWHLLHGGNVTLAEQFLRASADMGNADAQFLVGALTATDAKRGGVAESALFYHFASQQGSSLASMALGYRYLHGYGAPRSCNVALRHYKTAADVVIRSNHALPNPSFPMQYFTPPLPSKLSDNQNHQPVRDAEERQRVEYLRIRAASSSNAELLVRTASLILFSDIFQRGSEDRAAHEEAVHFLKRAVDLGSLRAKALLGHVYAYGLVENHADVYEAIHLYEDVVKSNDTYLPGYAEAANGLGRVYFHGLGGTSIDYERAMANFKIAGRAGHADAVYNSAVLMANTRPEKAKEYLEAAADVRHVAAIFRLARMKEKKMFHGVHGADHNCEAVVNLYKRVAEHNQLALTLMRHAADACLDSRFDLAQRLYMIAAEPGYEVAEHNAAWLMERYQLSSLDAAARDSQYSRLVPRGMAQGDVDAFVRAADMEYALGNHRIAMKHYLQALRLDARHARALYSAGYMCEHGLGTVSHGPNLERARGYYERAEREEPTLVYLYKLLKWRVDAKLWLKSMTRQLGDFFVNREEVTSSPPEVAAVSQHQGDTQQTVNASPSEIVFASAMVFDGETSRIVVDGQHPKPSGGITLDFWMWISEDASAVERPQVVAEWQDGVAVVLQPRHDRTSWQLNVQASSATSSLIFTNAAFVSRQWYHVAIVVEDSGDDVASMTSLFIDGTQADVGHLHLGRRETSRLLLSIGQPLSDAHDSKQRFTGQLANFRLWESPLSADEAGAIRTRSSCNDASGRIYLCLQFDVAAHKDAESMREETTSRIVDLSEARARHVVQHRSVKLRMIRFPPPN